MSKRHRRAAAAVLLVLFVCMLTMSSFAVIADGQTIKKEAVFTYDGGSICMHWIEGTNEALYCIDQGAGSDYSFTLPSGSVTVTPSAYWNALPAQIQQALRLLLYYAPKTYTSSTKYQCAAAQIIAWEYIHGLRALDNYQTYPISYTAVVTGNATANVAYRSLIQKIQRHMLIPTINGDTVTVTGLGEENGVYTYYDTNSVLAGDWEAVSPDPDVHVSVAQNGGNLQNRLRIWLSGDIGDRTVTVTLRHKSTTDVMGNPVDPRASTARWIANYPNADSVTGGQPLVGGTLPDPMTARVQVRAELSAPLEIVKESEDGEVAGISFRIEKYEGSGIGWWEYANETTDAGGRILLEDLEPGERLRVTEIVPEGYVCDSDNPQEITLTSGTNALNFRNHPLCSLEILKESTDGAVSGITFRIEKYEGGGIGWREYGTRTTDAEGRILLEDLELGERLRVTEIVPEGYECTSDNPAEITVRAGTNTVTFSNRAFTTLEIIKSSEDGNIEGIPFVLEVLCGEDYAELGRYSTDAHGRISIGNLTPGEQYRIREDVPEGYVCTVPSQTVDAEPGTCELRFENRRIRGSLRIVKLDKATQTPLQGAGFRIYDREGTEVAEGYTDGNGELSFDDLLYGTYTYREFQAPAGFAPDDTAYDFAVREDGEEIVRTADNSPKEGSITVCKTDEEDRPLAGVTFLLEYSADDGQTWTPVQYRESGSGVTAGSCTSMGLGGGRLVTGEDGIAVFTGLCIDTQLGQVRYRVTEVSTVPGYRLLAGYAFEGSLSEQEQTDVSFAVVNQPEFTLPATGGRGFTALMAIAAAVLTAAGAVLVIYRKTQ